MLDTKIKISLDAMGGDRGCEVVVPAAIAAIKKYPELHLVLVGDQEALLQQLNKYPSADKQRLTIHHTSQIVSMDESPALALKNKKDSSMRVAIDLVKNGVAQACVSAGNTGALMATSRFVLKTIPGVDRPAIISLIPAENKLGWVRMLDLGANVDCTGEALLQFAIMGAVLSESVDGIVKPRIALLNVGEEKIKGNECVKAAAELLEQAKNINYIGYIEGDKIFTDYADVVVCDGFVGNIVLKSLEGLSKFIGKKLKRSFMRNLLSRLVAGIAFFVLRDLKKQLNTENYNGASLIGLQGIVIKSHGGTTVNGFVRAIEEAMLEVKQNIIQLISERVTQLLQSND